MTKIEKLELEYKEEIEKLILNKLKDFDLSNCEIKISVFESGCLIVVTLRNFFDLYIQYESYIRTTKLKMDIIDNVKYKPPYVVGTTINDYLVRLCSLEEYIELSDSKDMEIIKYLYSNKDILEKELKNILE